MRAETGPGWVLRCGDWREVLADVEACDAVITDPPYSARTHNGQANVRARIAYASLSPLDVEGLVADWSARSRGWIACMTDDALAPVFREHYAAVGRYAFAAVPVLQHRPRLTGDGPGSGTVWLMVSRPRGSAWQSWGSLPCWYEAPPDHTGIVVGAKPLDLMRAIVRDYTRPGDLVVDPYAGGGTTLLAAAMEGRRAIGAELDPETFEKAVARLRRGFTTDLFNEVVR
jgi:site-specific DNA-methyltransferase (adenine-specific)